MNQNMPQIPMILFQLNMLCLSRCRKYELIDNWDQGNY